MYEPLRWPHGLALAATVLAATIAAQIATSGCSAGPREKTEAMLCLEGDIRTWQELEDPAELVVDTLRSVGVEMFGQRLERRRRSAAVVLDQRNKHPAHARRLLPGAVEYVLPAENYSASRSMYWTAPRLYIVRSVAGWSLVISSKRMPSGSAKDRTCAPKRWGRTL